MKGVFVRACLLCVFLDGCSGGSSACGLVGAHGDVLQGSRRRACFAPSLLGHFLLGGHGGEAAELAWRPSCHQASCDRRGQLAGAPLWSGLGENLGDFGARRRIVLGSRILGTGTGGGGDDDDGRMAGTRLGLAMTSASDASHGRPGSADPKRKWSVVRADGRKGARRSSRPAGGSEWRPGDALPGDTRQCNAALQQLARRGDARTAAILLESMDLAGVKRDIYTYNSAMNACCRSSKRSRGMLEDMLTEMQGRGIKPSTVTYNTLLKGAAYIRDVGWAESLVKGMKEAGLEKDHITYSTFVNVCSVAGNIGRAMKGLEEMLGAGISPTESTLTSIIKGCEVAGDLDSARKAYEHSNAGMSSAVSNCVELLQHCRWFYKGACSRHAVGARRSF
jgi:pentatricopeptide repeat protein